MGLEARPRLRLSRGRTARGTSGAARPLSCRMRSSLAALAGLSLSLADAGHYAEPKRRDSLTEGRLSAFENGQGRGCALCSPDLEQSAGLDSGVKARATVNGQSGDKTFELFSTAGPETTDWNGWFAPLAASSIDGIRDPANKRPRP